MIVQFNHKNFMIPSANLNCEPSELKLTAYFYLSTPFFLVDRSNIFVNKSVIYFVDFLFG